MKRTLASSDEGTVRAIMTGSYPGEAAPYLASLQVPQTTNGSQGNGAPR